MSQDTLSVELEIKDDKAEVVLSRSKQKLDDFVKTAEKAQPHIKFRIDDPFAGKLTTDFDTLSKRVEETRRRFSEIAKVRLDGGSIGNLSREILTAQNHSRQLAADIVNIKKELANPNRTSSITFLTASLRAAEEEADRLSRKLNSLPTGVRQGGGGAANNLKLTGFQKQNLSYQVNDVLTMAAMGANPTQILASQGGQIAQIFNPAQITAFTAAYGGLVTILGAGAAAIALTYKITGDMREQAERQLAVQTKITAELNKQRIAFKEADQAFAEQRANAARSDNFSRSVANESIEQLTRRKQRLEESIGQSKTLRAATIFTSGEKSDQYKALSNNIAIEQNELLDIENRLRNLPFERNKAFDESFSRHNEDFKKSLQDNAEFDKKQIEKRKELSKKLTSLTEDYRDSLISVKSTDNPLVKIMSDFEFATDRARKKYEDLSKLLGTTAFADQIADIERAKLTKAINLQRFENQSGALKFDQDARKLAALPERQFADFTRRLELINRKVDFTSNINNLNRQISESEFYSDKYNPNNPKSFNESRFSYAERDRFASIAGNRQRGESLSDFEKRRSEAIDIGIRARDAITEIASLGNLSLDGTGVYGKGAVADKVLAAIPSREELLKSLNSPFADIRGNADFLLRAQTGALQDKKAFEQQKFKDFIEDQKTSEFGKVFAREQIALINGSKITDIEKAKQRLAVTQALGNDLDAELKRQQIQDFVAARNDSLNKDKEALTIAADTKKAVEAIVSALTKQGIKIDTSTLPVPQVNVGIKSDGSVSTGLQSSATSADVENYYSENDANYRIGDARKAGSLCGSTLIP